MKWKSIVGMATLSVVLAAPANAAVIGQLNLDGGGEEVTVGLTFIDWHPVGGGAGTFEVTGGTTLSYTGGGGGTIDPGDTGVIKDLDSADPFPVVAFMTFPLDPAVSFDLHSLGPGSPNTDCSGLALGETCSPFVGSPFILVNLGPGGSSVILAAFGVADDGDGLSAWSGSFSTQIPTMTPAQIQAHFGCQEGQGIEGCSNVNATITNAYSGSFVAQAVPVPEPTMLAMLGIGLLGTGYYARRRRK